jgi:hypothetical protein
LRSTFLTINDLIISPLIMKNTTLRSIALAEFFPRGPSLPTTGVGGRTMACYLAQQYLGLETRTVYNLILDLHRQARTTLMAPKEMVEFLHRGDCEINVSSVKCDSLDNITTKKCDPVRGFRSVPDEEIMPLAIDETKQINIFFFLLCCRRFQFFVFIIVCFHFIANKRAWRSRRLRYFHLKRPNG